MTDIIKILTAAAAHRATVSDGFPIHLNVHEDGILVRAMNGEDRFSRLVVWADIGQIIDAIDDAVEAVGR